MGKDKEPESQAFDTRHMEMSLLGWAMTWPERFYEIQTLSDEVFSMPACARLFKTMKKLYEDGGQGAIDTPAMIARGLTAAGTKEDDAFALLTDIQDYAPSSPEGFAYIRDQVVRQAVMRNVDAAGSEISTLAKSGIEDPEELTALAMASLQSAIAVGSKTTIKSMGEQMQAEIEKMERADQGHEYAQRGLSTGITAVDDIINGIVNKKVYVIAARPSVGKTAFVSAMIGAFLNQGASGLFVSQEMDAEECAVRMICHTAGLNIANVTKGLLKPTERRAYAEHAQEWMRTPWFIHDAGGMPITKLCSSARRLTLEHDIKWLAVDYLQLMDHQKQRGESTNDAIARTSQAVKALAMSLDIPIIMLSQLNRGSEGRDNKRPRLADLRDSGAIEQDADVVMFLYRDAMYWSPEEREEHRDKPCEMAEVIVAKQRNGPIDTAKVAFYPSCARYANLPEDYGYTTYS
jgi:replicative DNA helicase